MASGTFYPLCPSWCSVLWSLGDAVACDVSEVGCSKPPLGPVLWALRSWRAAEGDLGRAEKETGRGLVARHGPGKEVCMGPRQKFGVSGQESGEGCSWRGAKAEPFKAQESGRGPSCLVCKGSTCFLLLSFFHPGLQSSTGNKART